MSTPLHVLIVEENPANIEPILRQLSRGGYDPIWICVGTESDLLASLAPDIDLILAGIPLPDDDIFRILQSFPERDLDIPIIIISDELDEETGIAAGKCGASDHLPKNQLTRLGFAVERALAQRQLGKENRQLMAQLSESEERFRMVVEQASDVIAILNLDHSLRYTSPGVSRILGYESSEILGESILTLVHPDDSATAVDAINHRTQSSGKVEAATLVRIRHKDGSYRVFEIIVNNLILNHMVDGILLSAHDITQRKQSEEALDATKEYARNIIESSLDMIIAVDRDRKIIEFNRAAEEAFGYRREQVLGQSIDLLYADPPVGTAISRITHTKGRSVQEVYNRRKNGEIFPTLLAASVLINSQGEEIGLMGISRDITELKRAEQELERRATEFSALHETTRDLATQHHLESLLQTIVRRAANLMHAAGGGVYLYDRERGDLQFVAVKDSRNPPAGSRLALGEGVAGRVAQTHQPMIVDDYRLSDFRPPKYAKLPITAVAEVPMLYGGELLGVLLVDEFETATRKFTEADVRLLELFATHAASAVYNAQLFEQVRSSRERLRILSHSLIQTQEAERRKIARELHDEVGQSLTSIQLNSQAIEPYLVDESARAMLQDNMKIVEQVLDQVRNLSLNLRPSILDDFGLIPALRWIVDRQRMRGGAVIEFHAEPIEMRPSVDIETVCFRVVQEALTNIIRHAHASRVTIQLAQRGSKLQLVIQDNGVGFNVAEAQKRATDGDSLGLLGMRERVNLVGGSLEIESDVEQGTRLEACFPIAAPTRYVERRTRRRNS